MKIINGILPVMAVTIALLVFCMPQPQVVEGIIPETQTDRNENDTIIKIMELIKAEYPDLTDEQLYEIADTNIKVADEFECIDPMLLMAIQKVESDFNCKAQGSKGELGINQIHPITGKELSSKFGWEYSEKMLHDIKSSTYLAGEYLNYLHERFGSLEAMLVGYNCGPTNGLRFIRKNYKAIPPQGFKYVKEVLNTYMDYRDKINNI